MCRTEPGPGAEEGLLLLIGCGMLMGYGLENQQ